MGRFVTAWIFLLQANTKRCKRRQKFFTAESILLLLRYLPPFPDFLIKTMSINIGLFDNLHFKSQITDIIQEIAFLININWSLLIVDRQN